MRNEASLEQWKTLYEAGTRIRELKPWNFGEEPLPFTAFQFGVLI